MVRLTVQLFIISLEKYFIVSVCVFSSRPRAAHLQAVAQQKGACQSYITTKTGACAREESGRGGHKGRGRRRELRRCPLHLPSTCYTAAPTTPKLKAESVQLHRAALAGPDLRHRRDKGKRGWGRRTRTLCCISWTESWPVQPQPSPTLEGREREAEGKLWPPGPLRTNGLCLICSRGSGAITERKQTQTSGQTRHTHTNTPVQTPVSHSPNISGHLTLHRRGWVLFVFAGLNSHRQGFCSFASLAQNSLWVCLGVCWGPTAHSHRVSRWEQASRCATRVVRLTRF